MSIAAIETRYAGCRFRSRLEARWAVFFDAVRIPWEYEPEGYVFGPGETYLPDFWLPSLNAYYEVKGSADDRAGMDRAEAFARYLGPSRRLFIAIGDIPRPETLGADNGLSGRDLVVYYGDGADYDYQWCVCPWCDKVGIEFDGYGDRICKGKCGRPDSITTETSPVILRAYEAARSARFEHGERG